MMILKPQDTLLLLKYWSVNKLAKIVSVRDLGEMIFISHGEVSKSTKRLITARLVVERNGKVFAESNAMLEWLCYGVRYAYPQENTGYGRGMETSWNCKAINSDMVPPSPALVWPIPQGSMEGILIEPFHKSVPMVAGQDELLYEALSLIEAIRGGKPRELVIARKLLTNLIKGNNEK